MYGTFKLTLKSTNKEIQVSLLGSCESSRFYCSSGCRIRSNVIICRNNGSECSKTKNIEIFVREILNVKSGLLKSRTKSQEY